MQGSPIASPSEFEGLALLGQLERSQMKRKPRQKLVHVSQFVPGPIRHKTLSPVMLAQIREIYEFHKQYDPKLTLEKCELDFMRDRNPQTEIDVNLKIKAAHAEYCRDHPEEHPRQVYKALLCVSLGIKP